MARFPSRENDIAVLAEGLTVYERFVALRADREPLSKNKRVGLRRASPRRGGGVLRG